MDTSRRLTIFEGPDCSGKTTAAKAYAEATGARYVHFDALPHVSTGLARMYVETMLPAVLGYQDVVFDRSWLSEYPYGKVFRQGADRLGAATKRMLERLAWRCGAVVVRCAPPLHHILRTFRERAHREYLDNEHQLREIYRLYREQQTSLPVVDYDYTVEPELKQVLVAARRSMLHPLKLASAGNWCAPVILIGERFAQRKNLDPHYQWPFASFSGSGCSQWLTRQLEDANVSEADLLWVNADQDLSLLPSGAPYIALGREAAAVARGYGLGVIQVPHPQYAKRFDATGPYQLIQVIEEVYNEIV